MRLFINFLAASAGGGLTYIHNVIPELAKRPDLHITVARGRGPMRDFRSFLNVDVVEFENRGVRRYWQEQFALRSAIEKSKADVLLSAGNFALRHSPVPQILLSRNSLYTSADFYCDLLDRSEYRIWVETRMRGFFAKRSTAWADITVAPSEAFAAELRTWTGGPRILAIHHGFNRESFTRDTAPLNAATLEKLRSADGATKLLFVSHYNYYRNFETLLRALPLVRDKLPARQIRLLLTCRLAPGENPGPYRPERAANLVRDLALESMVVELGAVPYHQLHHLYGAADVYVTPAYAETFAHPLVEAMSSGLPVIASDLPVHREICRDAALYFPRFSPDALAERVAELVSSPELGARLSKEGLARSATFSWEKHVDQLLSVAQALRTSHPRPDFTASIQQA